MDGSAMTTGAKNRNRAKFVRSFDSEVPVADIIEQGKEAGLELTPADVHSARYYERQRRQKAEVASAPKRGRKPGKKKRKVRRQTAMVEEPEDTLVALPSTLRLETLSRDELVVLRKLVVRVGVRTLRVVLDELVEE